VSCSTATLLPCSLALGVEFLRGTVLYHNPVPMIRCSGVSEFQCLGKGQASRPARRWFTEVRRPIVSTSLLSARGRRRFSRSADRRGAGPTTCCQLCCQSAFEARILPMVWRRGELNPCPRSGPRRHLHAYPVVRFKEPNVAPAHCRLPSVREIPSPPGAVTPPND
jgi:hypothetical protein